jgi:hypothetical protein
MVAEHVFQLQMPAYNLARLAAWGWPGVVLAPWDPDEYLSLPGNTNIMQMLNNSCFKDTAVMKLSRCDAININIRGSDLRTWRQYDSWHTALTAGEYHIHKSCTPAHTRPKQRKYFVDPNIHVLLNVHDASVAPHTCCAPESTMFLAHFDNMWSIRDLSKPSPSVVARFLPTLANPFANKHA